MKNIFKSTLLAAVYIFFAVAAFAQGPQGFNYQAVMRNASGALLANTNVGMRLSIINGTATSTTVLYSETRTATTTAQGLLNIQIGDGTATATTGNLSTVNWLDSNKFLKVEIDPACGSSYADFGTTQLLNVPYALQSKQASTIMTYGSGTANADKMIVQHSPAYPTWGLQYSDPADNFNFLASGTTVMQVALGSQTVSVGPVTSTTAAKLNVASSSTTTPAISIDGSVRAAGTNKFAFIHTKTSTNSYATNGTTIDNPLINNDPNVILVVTHNLSASGSIYLNIPIGVYYDSGIGRWVIFTENATAITNGVAFNVIAIKY
jgi:hypothetical protein